MGKDIFRKINRAGRIFGSLRWLFELTKPYIPRLLLLVMIGVVTTLLGVSSSVISKHLIDAATAAQPLTPYIVVLILLSVVSMALSLSSSLITMVVNEKYSFHIRQKMFDRILSTVWSDIVNYHSGDLLTRLKSDIGAITGGFTDVIPHIFLLSVQLVAAFFTLYFYDRTMALFALILGPIAAVIAWLMGRKLKNLQKKVQQTESAYSSFLQESLENIMIVKSFRAEERSSARLKELFHDRLNWVVKKNKMTALTGMTISLIFSAGYLTAFIYGAVRISQGLITYGTMTAFLTLVAQIQGPIYGLARTFPSIISVLASAERVTEILNLKQEKESLPVKREAADLGLEFKGVEFGYLDELVIKNADFKILPGDSVAIVGPSGIGKTTLVRLIMSFVEPNKGEMRLLLDGSEPLALGPSARDLIAYVPQGNTLFSGTIADNLRMGKPDVTEDDMAEALKTAAAEFVLELPDGVNTLIGERGYRLSEGQAQRVAIARALIRKSPLLILDEATSSLDEKAELRILRGIKELRHKPTCIIITHRKSILPYCNRIIAIENGVLVEEKRTDAGTALVK